MGGVDEYDRNNHGTNHERDRYAEGDHLNYDRGMLILYSVLKLFYG